MKNDGPVQGLSGETDMPTTAARHGTGDHELILIQLLNIVLRNRRLLVWSASMLFLVVVSLTLVLPRTYTAAVSFMPNSPGGGGTMSALAAQYGFSLPASEAGLTADFYSDLLQSRPLLLDVIDAEYEDVPVRTGIIKGESVKSGTLVELLDIDTESYPVAREFALRRLRKMVSVSIGRFSGVVRFSVSAPSAHLSHEIAQRMLELIHEFNNNRRQSQASAERYFAEERLQAARVELRAAEDELQAFLQRNRVVQSAELLFEQDRLQREIVIRQQVVATLTQAYERARIDEVRDTPVITVVQAPEVPALPNRRYLILKGMLSLAFGAGLGVVLAFAREFNSRLAKHEANNVVEEFNRLKAAAVGDIFRPWRLWAFKEQA